MISAPTFHCYDQKCLYFHKWFWFVFCIFISIQLKNVNEGASVCVRVLMVLHHKIYHSLFAVVLDYWTSTLLRVYLSVFDATYFGRCMYSWSSLEMSGIQMTNHSSKQWFILNKVHGAMSQKTGVFMLTLWVLVHYALRVFKKDGL
jgi:hypothetical protein